MRHADPFRSPAGRAIGPPVGPPEERHGPCFRRFAERAPDFLFRICLRPQPRFEYASPAARAITGYSPDDFYADAMLLRRIAHPDDLALVDASLARMRAGETDSERIEVRWIHRDGRVRWVEQQAAVVRCADGELEALEVIARDVTSRVEAAERLRHSEAVAHTFAQHALDLFFRYRLHPPGIEYVSPSALAFTGYTPEELVADPLLAGRLLHPEDRERLASAVERLAAFGASMPQELRLVRRDGRVVWIEHRSRATRDATGTIVGIEGVARDVTEQHEAAARLHESALRARALVDALPTAFGILDAGGRIVSANRAWCDLADAQGDDADRWREGGRIDDALAAAGRRHGFGAQVPAVLEGVRAVLTGTRASFETELCATTPERRWCRYQVTAVAGDGPGRAVIVHEDATERHHAEQRLRLLSSAIEHATDTILIADADERIEYVNRAFEELSGLSRDEVLGRRAAELSGGADHPMLHGGVAHGPRLPYVSRRRTAQGRERYHENVITPVVDAHGERPHFVLTGRDVTARTESDRRFQKLLEHASDVIVILGRDRRIRYESPSAATVFGHEPGARLGRPHVDYVHPDDRERVLQLPEGFLETPGATHRLVLRVRHASGEWRVVETIGRNLLHDPDVDGFVLNLRDVTEREEAEEARRRTDANFRLLLDRLPDAVCVHRDGVAIYANEALATLLARRRDALVGARLTDFVRHADRASVEARLAAAGALCPGRSVLELQLERADGTVATSECTSLAVDFGGSPAVLTLVRDITERKEMQTRLMLADRMVSVGTLAAGVAHEINNPLAYVTVNLAFVADEVQRLAARDADPRLAQVAEALAETREGTQRVRQIVRDLRTFSRADEEKRGPVDLVRVTESCLAMAWNEIRHRARLVKDFGAVPAVVANEARLGQVVLNLLVNAAHAIREGDAERNEIRVTIGTDARGHARLAVRDTGCGIPRANLARIFDPFFTTKPVGVGTGLGLSICHGIVAQLGGSISVESVEGEGSTFSIVVPPSVEVEAPRAVPAAAPAMLARAPRVLVVDDERLVGLAVARLLRGDHEVEHVTDAREALERLAARRYDAVLCDLMMPDLCGMDLHALVERASPEQARRFVFMTGGAFTPAAREFLDRMRERALEKPFDEPRLRERLAAALAAD